MRVKLKDICEKTFNINWKNNLDRTFKYIDLSSVSREKLLIIEDTKVNVNNAPSRAKQIVHTDDIIFATTRPTLKRITIIPKEYDSHICSTGFAVLRIKNTLAHHRYIFYSLQSENFMKKMEDMQHGASYPAVSNKDVMNYEIPLPPLPKQKAIAKKLDLAQKLIDLRKQSITKLDDLAKSVFVEMFGIYLYNRTHLKAINEVCDFIDYRGKTPIKVDNGIKLITAKNVKFGYLQENPKEYIHEDFYEQWLSRGVVKNGDILFTTEAPLGNICKLNVDTQFVIGQRLIAFKLYNIVNADYLVYCFLSEVTQHEISKKSTGSTVKGIRSKELKKIEISIPPLPLQNKFAKTIQAIEAQKALYAQELVKLEESFSGLLQESFA